MNTYTSYLYNHVPFIKRNKFNEQGVAIDTATLKNPGRKHSFPAVYAEPMEYALSLLDRKDLEARHIRLAICCKDENLIRKTALLIANELHRIDDALDDDIDEEGFLDDLYGSGMAKGANDEDAASLAEITLSEGEHDERIPVNIHLMKTKQVDDFMEKTGLENILYTGITPALIKDQMEAISSDNRYFVFVALPPEVMSLPETSHLLHERGFEILMLEEPDRSHYADCFDELVKAGGISFASNNLQTAVRSALIAKSGHHLSEEYLADALYKAAKRCILASNAKTGAGEKEALKLNETHFKEFLSINGISKLDQLMGMTGLEDLKKVTKTYLTMHRIGLTNPKMKLASKHMIFTGNPGTGKTTGAKLLSDILAAEGNSNGTFLVADRTRLIGSYVGHTAPKVATAFEEARGGILFVDEAGFFLNRHSGGYVEEALKEFIRYMDLYRDEVIVIFAMYASEVQGFLNLDNGLSSRIGRIVSFKDYSIEEMAAIFTGMAKDRGLSADAKAMARMKQYLKDRKYGSKNNFGNARDVRKLCDAVVCEVAMRLSEGKSTKKTAELVTLSDMEAAIRTLTPQIAYNNHGFGFGNCGERMVG